ncbi:cytochrome P450 [Fretibacter rubidus]|uniref:cytochrome P450 n=1 Tax=Fretibacter rubidus TaxID=570162 RepID=UPI00352A790B
MDIRDTGGRDTNWCKPSPTAARNDIMTASPASKPSDGLFYPPHAKPLTGKESFVQSTYKFLKNPLEGFGPLAYAQPIVSLKTFWYRTHVVSDPVGMLQVLGTESAKFQKAPIDGRILGPATKEGLLSVGGDQWKTQRRAVAPIFAKRHMADLAPMIADVLRDFKAKIGEGGSVELNAAMADVTFDVLAKTLLGDPSGMDRERLKTATRKVVTSAGTLRPDDLLPMPRWMPRPIPPSGSRALKALKAAADDLLDSRVDDTDARDLVGLLVSATDPHTGRALSRRERRDNLIGFFIAGHETTALTLTWALYLAGMHGATFARLRDEVDAVRPDGDISYDDMAVLPFTRAVIDETMRLFPPAPILNRECIEPTTLYGRDIAPNDVVILNNYIMHRTDRLWGNPLAFDPDRFLRDPSLRNKGAPFMPFGAGPRICVGMAFAIMEAVMGLATLVRDYDIDISADCYPRPLMTVTLRPEGGIKAKLTARAR